MSAGTPAGNGPLASRTGTLRWALGLSLLLNLFLIAAGIGFCLVMQRHHADFNRTIPPGLLWEDASRHLTPAAREHVVTMIRAAALSGEGDMNTARDLRARAAKLAVADPYDAPRISALSEQARGYENSARAKVENALIAGMKGLPADERAAVANNLLRASFRFRRFSTHDTAAPAPAVSPAKP